MYIEIEMNDIKSLSDLQDQYALLKNQFDKLIDFLKTTPQEEIYIESYHKPRNEFYVKIKGEINLRD